MFFSILQSRTWVIIIAHRDMLAELPFLELGKESALQTYSRRKADAAGDKEADSHASRELRTELCCRVQGVTAP